MLTWDKATRAILGEMSFFYMEEEREREGEPSDPSERHLKCDGALVGSDDPLGNVGSFQVELFKHMWVINIWVYNK